MPDRERALLDEILAAKVFSRGSLLRHSALTANRGIACEFGVFKGQSLRQIRNYRKPPVFGFDSWEGLPEVWMCGSDKHDAGHFACDMPSDFATGVHLVKGWFGDTIPQWLSSNAGDIQLLHIDCDLYSSCREALFGLNGRIKSGAVIVFDELCSFDGSYSNWRDGEWKALNEWLNTGRRVKPIGRTDHQQVAFIVEE